MSSLRKLIFLLIPGVFFLCSQAWAGLSGFTSANPYTREEEILKIDTPPVNIPNYRQEMRDNVTMLSDYAKGRNPDFEIIVHDVRELLKKDCGNTTCRDTMRHADWGMTPRIRLSWPE